MCGRYTQTSTAKQLQDRFKIIKYSANDFIKPSHNVSPTQHAPIMIINKDQVILKTMRWGLIPSWAKSIKIANHTINARAESLTDKPSFRDAYKTRRCLVIADGYYEWRAVPGHRNKQAMHYTFKDKRSFAFAGLWDTWQDPQEKTLETFTIITTEPNKLAAQVHDRMPVILNEKDYPQWLDPKIKNTDRLQSLLKPYPSENMETQDVSTDSSKIKAPRAKKQVNITWAPGDLFK